MRIPTLEGRTIFGLPAALVAGKIGVLLLGFAVPLVTGLVDYWEERALAAEQLAAELLDARPPETADVAEVVGVILTTVAEHQVPDEPTDAA